MTSISVMMIIIKTKTAREDDYDDDYDDGDDDHSG
jgi:hypothetical protein